MGKEDHFDAAELEGLLDELESALRDQTRGSAKRGIFSELASAGHDLTRPVRADAAAVRKMASLDSIVSSDIRALFNPLKMFSRRR